MDFKSEFFDNVDDLVNEKNNLVRLYRDRFDREVIIRKFYNGQDTMSEEEAEEQGRDQPTNHLMGHKAISKIETRIYQIYAASMDFVDVIIDTNRPEQDYFDSVNLSRLLSKAVRHSGMLSSLWRSCAGELALTGRAPLIHESADGWCPSLAPRLLLPKGSPLVTSEISYAFNPKEMSMAALKRLKKASEGGGGLIDGAAVDELITVLKEQVACNSKTGGSVDNRNGHEHGSSITDDSISTSDARKTTVNVWWYYEIDRESPSMKVAATLFTEALVYTTGTGKDQQSKSMNSRMIGHIPDLIENPEGWLQLMVLDSEIGGVKTFDSTKGIAELSYNSDMKREEFMNVMIEGDMSRAMPRFQEDEGGNPDAILDWNPNDESVVPKGIKEFKLGGSSNSLMTPLSILSNNSAELTSEVGGGNQGQLRVQALHAQQESQEIGLIRLRDVYDSLDIMLAEIVYRFMVSNHSPKAKGIDDIKWFRKEAEKIGLDVKELGKREFKRFCYLTVKAKRLDGGGILDLQVRGSQMMLQNIGAYPPESRPAILQRAAEAMTQDPDFAQHIVKTPPIIINQQRQVAEAEWSTIRNRASTGNTLPISPSDIDQDHLPSHLLDAEAMLRNHAIVPWTQIDAAAFKLGLDHINQHITRMLASPVSNKEAEVYNAKLQQFAAVGDQIIEEMAQQQQQQQAAQGGGPPLTQKERADLQLKAQEQARKDEELRLKQADAVGTEQQRRARTDIAARNQRLKEVATSAKIAKEGFGVAMDVAAANGAANGAPR
jgi:hypothetical protein